LKLRELGTFSQFHRRKTAFFLQAKEVGRRSRCRGFCAQPLFLLCAKGGLSSAMGGRGQTAAVGFMPSQVPESGPFDKLRAGSGAPGLVSIIEIWASCSSQRSRGPASYFAFSGNLNPMYVPELSPIRPSNAASKSGIARSSCTAFTNTTPSTTVQTMI